MKTTLTLLSFFAVSLGFGQIKLEPAPAVKNSKTSTEWQVKAESVPDSLVVKTVAHCNEMIAAIDYKVNFVNADPVQKAEAEKNGWFDQMTRNRNYFVSLRDELLKRTLTK